MNYIGVVIAALSAIFYIFVKSEVATNKIANFEEKSANDESNKTNKLNFQKSSIDDINPTLKRIIGVSFALFSGVMYGLNYAPILYCIDNYEGASTNNLDYLYSFCSGTLITSIVFLFIYCIFKKNEPVVYANVILPGFISGN